MDTQAPDHPGDVLGQYLEERGMSLSELARRVGVSRTAVHYWIDKGRFTTERLRTICAALGISESEFFARVPAPAPIPCSVCGK